MPRTFGGYRRGVENHRFICTGCHIRFTSVRECPVCGSPVVPIVELPAVPDRSMRPPEPARHEISFVLAVIAGVLAVPLAWGETTIWGVVPCGLLTAVLLVAPIRRWEQREPGDELGSMVRAVPFDGYAIQEGAARAVAAGTSRRVPVGGAGLMFGVLWPLITIQPSEPETIAAAGLAIGGFLLAWIRRVRREAEASAGRGVPL